MGCESIFSAVGTKFYIAPAAALPSPQNATTWAAVTGWLEVGEIGSIGPYGAEVAKVEWKSLSGTVCKSKGSTNYGSAELSMALVPEDTGQLLLQTALGSKLTFPCKVVYSDATAVLDAPSVDYFGALIMSFKKNPGSDPDAIVQATVGLELNGPPTFVARHDSTP